MRQSPDNIKIYLFHADNKMHLLPGPWLDRGSGILNINRHISGQPEPRDPATVLMRTPRCIWPRLTGPGRYSRRGQPASLPQLTLHGPAHGRHVRGQPKQPYPSHNQRHLTGDRAEHPVTTRPERSRSHADRRA